MTSSWDFYFTSKQVFVHIFILRDQYEVSVEKSHDSFPESFKISFLTLNGTICSYMALQY